MKEGLYEHIISRALQDALDAVTDCEIDAGVFDPAESHLRLARYVATELTRVLRGLPEEERVSAQLDLCNAILELLAEHARVAARADAEIAPPGRLLRAVYRQQRPLRPETPLGLSTLLTRNPKEPALGHELAREIGTADRTDALVSFVTLGGIRSLRESLESHARSGRAFRLLTTTYTGATEADAVEAIAQLPGVEVRISYDGRRTRLHAKAWLFHRDTGLSTAYVGSANLSRAALFGGHEWMMHISESDMPHVIDKFRGAFDTLWEDPEFEKFDPTSDECRRRLRSVLSEQRGASPARKVTAFFSLRPFPYQEEILERLEAERQLHGRQRNLVVAATGTGKTMIAGFDYANQIGPDGIRPRLLYLAHREEILLQALDTFRHILRDEAFGELLAGGQSPMSCDHLFATIQSVRSRGILDTTAANYWQYVVVDECHHLPAPSYRAVVERLTPRVLLGLTATPERFDGQSLLPDFGGHVAAEMRLWQALERQLLVPFEYYGLHDGVDLRDARWTRGAYADEDLEKLYTGNDRRAELVIAQFLRFCGDPCRIRALGFCVTVAHAEFMARKFQEAGIPAEAVHGQTASLDRTAAPGRLERREVNVLFTCDLYNEGVDLPWIDTLLLLRPTASAPLFLQQLGRGLRLHEYKTACLVLDFIGQHRQEFRFDRLLSALAGIPRGRLQAAVEDGFPTLPSGCTLQMDRVARDIVLDNLRRAVGGGIRRLTDEIQQLHALAPGRSWSLQRYLDESGRELEDVYAAGGWTTLRRSAGLIADPHPQDEADLNRRFVHLLHVDEPERLHLYREVLSGNASCASLDSRDRVRLLMLGYQLYHERDRLLAPEGVEELFSNAQLRQELVELLTILSDRVPLAVAHFPAAEWPLALHRHYDIREVLTAVGRWTETAKPHFREGVLRLDKVKTELLLVTLDKSSRRFSPTTRYEDYAISPTLFHWQTQSTASVASPSGRRYIEQESNGWRFLLFVREHPGDAYAFLGDVRYREHRGDRPISITWQVEHAIPGGFFQRYASLAAA